MFCKEGLVDIVDDNINGNVVDIIDLHDSSAVVVERGEMSSAAAGDSGEDGRVLVIKFFFIQSKLRWYVVIIFLLSRFKNFLKYIY